MTIMDSDTQKERLDKFLSEPSDDRQLLAQLLRDVLPEEAGLAAGKALGKLVDDKGLKAIGAIAAAAAAINQTLDPAVIAGMASVLLQTSPHPALISMYLRACKLLATLADPLVAETALTAIRRAPERWRPEIMRIASHFAMMDTVVAQIVEILSEWRDIEKMATVILTASTDIELFRQPFEQLFVELGLKSYSIRGRVAELYNRLIVPSSNSERPISGKLLASFVAALRHPPSADLRKLFWSIGQEGAVQLFEVWDIALRDEYAALLTKLSIEFELKEPDNRLNFAVAISNIGDTSACLCFMTPIARSRGLRINVLLPDTRTNVELAKMFESDMITFYFIERGRLLELPSWTKVTPQLPGVLHNFVMSGEVRPVLRAFTGGPSPNRLLRMQAAFGLNDSETYTRPTAWRHMGELSTKLDVDWRKAIIIAPISVSLRNRLELRTPFTLADLDAMWMVMLDALLDAGWQPVINGRNHNTNVRQFSERVIQADLSLAELLQAVSKSRAFIGERSGLHELVVIAEAGAPGSVFAIHPEGFLYVPDIAENACKDILVNPLLPDLKVWLRDWVLETFGRAPD